MRGRQGGVDPDLEQGGNIKNTRRVHEGRVAAHPHWLPRPETTPPYPDWRFDVTLGEPGALAALAGICAGALSNQRPYRDYEQREWRMVQPAPVLTRPPPALMLLVTHLLYARSPGSDAPSGSWPRRASCSPTAPKPWVLFPLYADEEISAIGLFP